MTAAARIAAEGSEPQPVLEVSNLRKEFPAGWSMSEGRRSLTAVDGVSLAVRRGECLGVVGESGCGKTTLARLIMGLEEPTSGDIRLWGKSISGATRREKRRFRRRIQIVFQDPYASLDPRMTVEAILEEPLRAHPGYSKDQIGRRVRELVELVGLDRRHLVRRPHEFSGGQRQRIAIARALALEPDCILLDEPVSALDVSVQAQIINLLADLQAELDLTYLFIAHDLSVVQHISTRVAVMYLGRVVEYGSTEDVFRNSRHPYTRALLSSVPIPDPELEISRARVPLEGSVPSPIGLPVGCNFVGRCPRARALALTSHQEVGEMSSAGGHQVPRICAEIDPDLNSSVLEVSEHEQACHFPSSTVEWDQAGSTS